jgi:hypothetical protein
MISDPERTTVLSCLGWIEGDALWHFDVASHQVDTIPLGSGARYVSLYRGGALFSLAHHFDGGRFEVTVRRFDAPTAVVARAAIAKDETIVEGDLTAWDTVPRLYTPYLSFEPWNDFVLCKVAPATRQIEVQRFEWFDDSYDKDYQGIVGALELPGRNVALVSVQRSSKVVVHDLGTGRPRGFVTLGGGAGNPKLELRNSGTELWAIDYDSLVVLRTEDLKIRHQTRLQGALSGSALFVGDLAFSPDDNLCVVGRPFSGDIVGVDIHTFSVRSRAKVGSQPLEVVALGNGKVVARDWKTGALLQGTLERRRWFGG